MIREEATLGHSPNILFPLHILRQVFDTTHFELRLLKPDSPFFWGCGGGVCQMFLGHSQIAAFEVKCVFWPVNWN